MARPDSSIRATYSLLELSTFLPSQFCTWCLANLPFHTNLTRHIVHLANLPRIVLLRVTLGWIFPTSSFQWLFTLTNYAFMTCTSAREHTSSIFRFQRLPMPSSMVAHVFNTAWRCTTYSKATIANDCHGHDPLLLMRASHLELHSLKSFQRWTFHASCHIPSRVSLLVRLERHS